MKQLIYNALACPDGTVLISRSQHDYQTHEVNGKTYMVDGGLAYERSSDNGDEVYLYKYLKEGDHEHNRTWFHWGTRGPDGNKPLTWVSLKELDTDHIEAIVETQHQMPAWIRDLMNAELQYRSAT